MINGNKLSQNKLSQNDQYSNQNIKFKIQKRIGFIFSIFIILLIFINLFYEIYAFGKIKHTLVLFYNLVLLIQSLIFFWTTRKGHFKIKRILQILFIYLDGLLTIFSDVNQVYFGISFLIFGSLLIMQYDLFEHRYINYIIFALLILVSTMFIYNYYFLEQPSAGSIGSEIEDLHKLKAYKITNVIVRVLFIALFLLLFSSIYIDQINFFKTLNELIIKEKESLESFANIGMMLNSMVHNFNNKIVTFLSSEYILTTILKKYEQAIEPSDMTKIISTCNIVRSSSDEMTLMIKDIRNLIKDKTNYNLQTYEINKTIENIAKQFKIAYEKRNIIFNLEKKDDLIFIQGNLIQFIQVIENLVKNSIEASENPQITIITGKEPQPYIIIKDNGVGIPFCFNCKTNNCLNCKEFQIGKTTKKEGSGTGMIFVQTTLKEMKANLKIESKKNIGTEVTIFLSNIATKKLDQMENIYLDKKQSAAKWI